MPLESFVQQDRTTPLGVIRTWTSPPIAESRSPVVFAIPGLLATIDDIVTLGEKLGILADMCLMRLPNSRDTTLSSNTLMDIAGAVSGLIEEMFPDRPVLLFGVSSGALIALGVRARNVVRVIAVEPPLLTGSLWPIVNPLRESLKRTGDPATSAFALETLGVDETQSRTVRHLGLMTGLSVPVEILLGDQPLQPPREVKRFPSFVDVAERRTLAALPGVRLHVLPETGHNVVGQAIGAVLEILREGCRRASAPASLERLQVDEPLLEAVPLSARRVLYCGPHGPGFASASRAVNPRCEVFVAGGPDAAELPAPGEGLFDAIVTGAPPVTARLADLAARLSPAGHLIARWALERDELGAALAPHGLALREPVDDSGTGVIRAQKLEPGISPQPALTLLSIAYAALLMDIRTRLPALGLRSDPALSVTYGVAPFKPPALAIDQPKILVLQRPAETRMEAWRGFLAEMIAKGWLVVMEYDDNPALIAEVMGKTSSEADLLRFSYVHAVQTSTPPLVDAFRPYNPEIALFPNSVFELLPFPEGDRPARVIYGGVLRGDYPVAVARSLGLAIAGAPETEFVVIGDRAVFEALPTERKRYYEYMPYEAYLELMSECAISLSPIEALPRRDTKSDAKFLDASRAGVLTIASPTIYDRVIEHGVNGLLAPRVEDWAPLLARALAEPDWSRAMARRAWDYVRSERMFADQVALRRDWYLDLWSRRAELNAALMARTPGLRELVRP